MLSNFQYSITAKPSNVKLECRHMNSKKKKYSQTKTLPNINPNHNSFIHSCWMAPFLHRLIWAYCLSKVLFLKENLSIFSGTYFALSYEMCVSSWAILCPLFFVELRLSVLWVLSIRDMLPGERKRKKWDKILRGIGVVEWLSHLKSDVDVVNSSSDMALTSLGKIFKSSSKLNW